jgi:hypothetical protein
LRDFLERKYWHQMSNVRNFVDIAM